MGLNRRVILGAATALVVAVVGLNAVAFADDPAPTATPTAGTTAAAKTDYRSVFLGKLASALGIDQAKVEAALKQAEIATIDQAVTNGDLAKNRADEMKARVEQNGASFGFRGLGGDRGFEDRGTRGVIDNSAVEKAVADKLGMTVADLETQLRSGKALADLAKDKGLTVQDLYTAAASAAKPLLDQAVKDGKLTQAQADQMLQQIQSGGLRLGGPHGGTTGEGIGEGRGGRGHR
jgi:polyhydroxyalkanoate synthesis regulator phasin